MYFPPRNYECPQCNCKFPWSEHHDFIGLGKPFCPECYMNFIKDNVPIGKEIDDDTKEKELVCKIESNN